MQLRKTEFTLRYRCTSSVRLAIAIEIQLLKYYDMLSPGHPHQKTLLIKIVEIVWLDVLLNELARDCHKRFQLSQGDAPPKHAAHPAVDPVQNAFQDATQ